LKNNQVSADAAYAQKGPSYLAFPHVGKSRSEENFKMKAQNYAVSELECERKSSLERRPGGPAVPDARIHLAK
jgi:hypothetical protein